TCSGLQHLSALTKCEEEGCLANLIPGPREDLYQTVADKDGEARKAAKGVGVPFFYRSAPGYWQRQTNKSGEENFVLQDGMIKSLISTLKKEKLSTKGATRRARTIYKTLRRTIPQAVKTQNFLTAIAKLYFNEGRMLRWETLMPVSPFYYEPIKEETRIKINRANKSAIHIIGYDTDKLMNEAYTSFAANYIHYF